jgi:hypothetical protein
LNIKGPRKHLGLRGMNYSGNLDYFSNVRRNFVICAWIRIKEYSWKVFICIQYKDALSLFVPFLKKRKKAKNEQAK